MQERLVTLNQKIEGEQAAATDLMQAKTKQAEQNAIKTAGNNSFNAIEQQRKDS